MDKLLLAVSAVFVIGLVAVVYSETTKHTEFVMACTAKGGTTFQTEDRTYCVKTDAFIKVGP